MPSHTTGEDPRGLDPTHLEKILYKCPAFLRKIAVGPSFKIPGSAPIMRAWFKFHYADLII